MFDDAARRHVARLAAPLALALHQRGVTASHVSWIGFALAACAAVAIASGGTWPGLALWLISRAADGLDGAIARAGGGASAFGGYLDITLDMAAYAAMVLGFAALYPSHPLLWEAVLVGYVLAITTTQALAAAAERGRQALAPGDRTFQFTRGLAEAGETSVVYALWVVFPQHVGVVGWAWVGLLLATAVQRSWLAWKHLE